MPARKLSDEMIISGIKGGLTNAEIARNAGCTPSGMNLRIARIRRDLGIGPAKRPHRKSQGTREFDLKQYDTVTYSGEHWRVIKICADTFTLRQTTASNLLSNHNKKQDLVLRKTAYTKQGSTIRKWNLPEVKVYRIETEAEKTQNDTALPEIPSVQYPPPPQIPEEESLPNCPSSKGFLRDIETLLDMGWEEDLLPYVERLARKMLSKGIRRKEYKEDEND